MGVGVQSYLRKYWNEKIRSKRQIIKGRLRVEKEKGYLLRIKINTCKMWLRLMFVQIIFNVSYNVIKYRLGNKSKLIKSDLALNTGLIELKGLQK